MNLLILILATLGLRCFAGLFSSCGERGPSLTECLLVAGRGLWPRRLRCVACGLWSTELVVVVRRPSCSAAHGVFPDHGLG